MAGQTFDGSADGTIQGTFTSIPIQAVNNAGGKDYFFNVDRNSAALLTIAP